MTVSPTARWNDLGFKNSLVNSPNIDKLAMGGVRLGAHCEPHDCQVLPVGLLISTD